MKRHLQTILAATVVSLFMCQIASALSSTEWAGEFNEWRNCGNSAEVAYTLDCRGGYCAAIRSQCEEPSSGVLPDVTYQTDYYSEEDGQFYCAPGYVVNGFDVDGWDNRGDDIALSCIGLDNVEESTCRWTGWISEETSASTPSPYVGNTVSCEDYVPDSYIHGMECDGGWCDNMRLFCCNYAPPVIDTDTAEVDAGDTEDTEDTDTAVPPVINLGPVNTETYYTVDLTQDLVITDLATAGWTPSMIVVGFASTDNEPMDGMVAVINSVSYNLTSWWQQIPIPYTTVPVAITVIATEPRDMRTTWWMQ